jgi:hypothetical protein
LDLWVGWTSMRYNGGILQGNLESLNRELGIPENTKSYVIYLFSQHSLCYWVQNPSSTWHEKNLLAFNLVEPILDGFCGVFNK